MNRRDAIKAAAASVAAMAGVLTGNRGVADVSPEVKSQDWQVTATYVSRASGEWRCVGYE